MRTAYRSARHTYDHHNVSFDLLAIVAAMMTVAVLSVLLS
jgi:hypothetical protein